MAPENGRWMNNGKGVNRRYGKVTNKYDSHTLWNIVEIKFEQSMDEHYAETKQS